jgi:hypothetical protein
MTARKTLRRAAALVAISAAIAAGAFEAASHTNAPDRSVADSTWGGIAPPQPSPTEPSASASYAPMDSTWGG